MYNDQEKAGDRLLQVIQEVANGNYSNDIMELTKDDVPEQIRTVAEAMGMMMVKVEAREYRLEQLVARLKELNDTIRRNSIATVSAMAHALAARTNTPKAIPPGWGNLPGASPWPWAWKNKRRSSSSWPGCCTT